MALRKSLVISVLLGACAFAADGRLCDPFIASRKCTALVEFKKGVHDSIALIPGGQATLHLTGVPAFEACQANFTPSALNRTMDTSVAGLLQTLGGLALLGGNPAPGAGFLAVQPDIVGDTSRAAAAGRAIRARAQPPQDADAKSIEAQLDAIDTEEQRLASILDGDRDAYKLGITGQTDDQGNIKVVGLNMVWGNTDESFVKNHIDDLRDRLTALVQSRAEPSIAGLQAELDAVSRSLGAYHQKYDVTGIDPQWLYGINDRMNLLAGVAARGQDYIGDILTIRTNLKQALAQFPDPAKRPYPPFTVQDLTVPQFVNNIVGVSISCKDSVTQAADPTTVTFSAYYTRLPWLDISAGPLFSLLGRHQVGVIPQSAAQMATNTNPYGTFGVTDRSSFQVIPMAFLEIHPRGFRCPWAKPANVERRFGYVCSAGLAVGVGPNNVTGSTQAEFFEGASFAIQRLSFIFGFHDGRVEKIGGGYGLGQPVPSSGYTPLITRYFSVHPAFGITYRIPIH